MSAEQKVQNLLDAEASIEIDGKLFRERISLPYGWDRKNKRKQGIAKFSLQFPAHSGMSEPWAIYFEKIGNGYEVWLNGVMLQRDGSLTMHNHEDYAQLPRLLSVPPQLLQADNQLDIRIRADIGRKAGVSRVQVGPQIVLNSIYRFDYFLRGISSALISMFSFLMGCIAFILWLSQPDHIPGKGLSRNPLYFYAALAELSWAFGVSYMFFSVPPVAWPWWGVLAISAGVVWRSAMVLFCLEVAEWREKPGVTWFRRWTWAMMISLPLLVSLSYAIDWPWLLTICYLSEGITVALFSLWFLAKTRRHKEIAPKMLAWALCLNVVVGVRDLYALRIQMEYVTFSWIRFSSVFFGLTLGAILLMRFRNSTAEARDLTEALAARVNSKEKELAALWEHTEKLARQEARTLERSLILRDMHDGVGSHISTAIRQLQSGQVKASDILLTLRDSLDQLKLSIDSMNVPVGDIAALLANLRYRLEPRLNSMDITLNWQVEKIPNLQEVDGASMRQLQFIFFEIISNIMQHAQASLVTIRAFCPVSIGSTSPSRIPRVCVSIEDNGVGFDVNSAERHGLMSMKLRVEALDAELVLESKTGHTKAEIYFFEAPIDISPA